MYKQPNLFNIFFNQLEEYKRIYAYDLLKVLYHKSNEGLNIQQIYLIFKNRKKALLRNIIYELNEGLVFCENKNSFCTKQRYFITNKGIEFLYEHLDK